MNNPDFIFNVTPGDVIYDCETYPNVFTCTFKHATTGHVWYFEISKWRYDLDSFCLFLEVLRSQGCRLVGFNNIGFDYPVIHYIYKVKNVYPCAQNIYDKAMLIINAHYNARFSNLVWESDWLVDQVDLFKIHHFDNQQKISKNGNETEPTGLKILEFNMRSENVEDLPFNVGLELTQEEIKVLAKYNLHDVTETLKFYHRTLDKIKLREDLTKSMGQNMINCSDVKIGEKILVSEIEKSGIQCYEFVNKKKKNRCTIYESIDLSTVIFDCINFELSEFEAVRKFLSSKTITETKGVFKNLKAEVDGITYKIGTGGLHGSVEKKIFKSNDHFQIVDVDVASFYPQLAIQNRMYPSHLGEAFCNAYLDIYKTRKTYAKGTASNRAYKLALNGAYGGSNNKYSPFFDAAYTMGITCNGQLLLLMLVEQMLKVPGLEMIQSNTDGITYYCPREYIEHTRNICKWWEQLTGLVLEEVLYSRMFVRDVNSYISEYEDGGLKRIGAYAHETVEENHNTGELQYNQNWSSRIIAKAAEAALVHGKDITDFILSHDDNYDFLLRTKVPRSSMLEWGGEQVQNIVRYYVSTNGDMLEKVMPPAGPVGAYKRANKLTDDYYETVLAEVGDAWDDRIHTKNKSKYEIRRGAVHAGYNVMLCNDLKSPEYQLIDENLNYDWYIKEAEKLVKPLRD